MADEQEQAQESVEDELDKIVRANTLTPLDVLNAPIRSDNIHIVRHVDPGTGYVYSQYVDATGQPVAGLSTTYHLQKANAGFIPPPT
jgi:hypothetical protein